MLASKMKNLENYFISLDNVAIAFSGGVDSCLLLKTASKVLGSNAVALIASFNSFQKFELDGAVEFCKENNIKYHIIEINELECAEFVENSADRCYYCKRNFMSRLKAYAHSLGIETICEGTNIDDVSDYRPGAKALKELDIKSPLKELGFTKDNIRKLARQLEIKQWNKPSLACLATRISYGELITAQKLKMIDEAESYLLSKGFTQLRVRLHNNVARIELLSDEITKMLDPLMRADVADKLYELGFEYVSLDLIGYKNGSMNKGILND